MCPKTTLTTDAGVNRKQRVESKKDLKNLQETYKHIGFGGVMHLPYGNLFPIGENTFLGPGQIEGVGTKVLISANSLGNTTPSA